MAKIEIDVTRKLGDLATDARIERSTRDSVTLRFTNQNQAEQFRTLHVLASIDSEATAEVGREA